jgi:hypothetical protein
MIEIDREFWGAILKPVTLASEVKDLLSPKEIELLERVGLPDTSSLLKVDITSETCPSWWREILTNRDIYRLGRPAEPSIANNYDRDFAWIELFRYFSLQPESIGLVMCGNEPCVYLGADLHFMTNMPSFRSIVLKKGSREVYHWTRKFGDFEFVNSNLESLLGFLKVNVSYFLPLRALDYRLRYEESAPMEVWEKLRRQRITDLESIDKPAFETHDAFWAWVYDSR